MAYLLATETNVLCWAFCLLIFMSTIWAVDKETQLESSIKDDNTECPAYKKHEFKKHQTLIFITISPLIRNWSRSEKGWFLFKNYVYIRNLENVTKSTLQLNRPVHIQMKTINLRANEVKNTFLE